MNIYKISQSVNDDYDTYDSAVVIAASEEEARNMEPNHNLEPNVADWANLSPYHMWAPRREDVVVEFIGTAKEGSVKGFVCASFNAG